MPFFHLFNCSQSLFGIFLWVALTACLCLSLSPFTEDAHSWFAARSHFLRGFPGGSVVKNLLLMQETQKTWVRSRGGEDPLEEGMATCSSILAWKISWTEEPGRLHFMGSQRVGHNWVTEHVHTCMWLIQVPTAIRIVQAHLRTPVWES